MTRLDRIAELCAIVHGAESSRASHAGLRLAIAVAPLLPLLRALVEADDASKARVRDGTPNLLPVMTRHIDAERALLAALRDTTGGKP